MKSFPRHTSLVSPKPRNEQRRIDYVTQPPKKKIRIKSKPRAAPLSKQLSIQDRGGMLDSKDDLGLYQKTIQPSISSNFVSLQTNPVYTGGTNTEEPSLHNSPQAQTEDLRNSSGILSLKNHGKPKRTRNPSSYQRTALTRTTPSILSKSQFVQVPSEEVLDTANRLVQVLSVVDYILSKPQLQISPSPGLESPAAMAQSNYAKWAEAGALLISKLNENKPVERLQPISEANFNTLFRVLLSFGTQFVQVGQFSRAHLLITFATSLYAEVPSVKANVENQRDIYSSLCLYHTMMAEASDADEDLSRASKYVNGAVIVSKRLELKEPASQAAKLDVAINLNNKAVVELKRNRTLQAKAAAAEAISMIEPMVFGLIQAEIVEPAQSPAFDLENEVQKNFGEMLRMLLISYLNYGQALEDKLEAKKVFHMGMKLCFQYLPGGREGYLFKKFYAKFSRVYKQVAEAIVASDSVFEEAESQLQRLPELLSLATFGQNQGRQRGELNIQESGSTKSRLDRQNLSFTIQDSNLAVEIGAPGANLIIQQRERVSSTSMPIMPQHESREELKERDDLIMAPPSQPKKSAVIQASQMFTQIDELPFVMADQTLEPENDTPEQNSSQLASRLPLRPEGVISFPQPPSRASRETPLRHTTEEEKEPPSKRMISTTNFESRKGSSHPSPTAANNIRHKLKMMVNPMTYGWMWCVPFAEKQAQKREQNWLIPPYPFPSSQKEESKKTTSQSETISKSIQSKREVEVHSEKASESSEKQPTESKKTTSKKTSSEPSSKPSSASSEEKKELPPPTNVRPRREKRQPAAPPAPSKPPMRKPFEKQQAPPAYQRRASAIYFPPGSSPAFAGFNKGLPGLPQNIVNDRYKKDGAPDSKDSFRSAGFGNSTKGEELEDSPEIRRLKPNLGGLRQEPPIASGTGAMKKGKTDSPTQTGGFVFDESNTVQQTDKNPSTHLFDNNKLSKQSTQQPGLARILSGGDDISSQRLNSGGLEDEIYNSFMVARNEEFYAQLSMFIEDMTLGEVDQTPQPQFEKKKNFFLGKLKTYTGTKFMWNKFQTKSLKFISQYLNLYSPFSVFRFNKNLIAEIKQKKNLTCARVVSVPSEDPKEPLVPFLITISANYDPLVTMDKVEEQDPEKKRLLMYNHFLSEQAMITMKAIPRPGSGKEAFEQECSLRELIGTFYGFSSLSSIDPVTSDSRFHSTIPFYHIETFAELCQHLLFPYIGVIDSPDDGGIDFQVSPNGLFAEPAQLTFLTGGSDMKDPAIPSPDSGPPSKDTEPNCEIQLYHITGLSFKLILTPIFDIDSAIFKKRSAINSQEFSQHVRDSSVYQSEFTAGVDSSDSRGCSLPINLKFQSEHAKRELFKHLPTADFAEFIDKTDMVLEAIEPVAAPQALIDTYFSPFLRELEKVVQHDQGEWLQKIEKEDFEFQSLFDNMQSTVVSSSLPKVTEVPEVKPEMWKQRLINLIINHRICHLQMKIYDQDIDRKLYPEAQVPMKMELMVFLKKDLEGIPKLKLLCIFASNETKGRIEVSNPHEIPLETLDYMFGQELHLDNFSSIQSSYTLAQLCTIYLESVFLKVEISCQSEGGGLSSDSDSIGSESEDSDFSSNSDSKTSSEPESVKMEGNLKVKQIESIQFKRSIIKLSSLLQDESLKEYPTVSISYSILASIEMKRLFGVRMTILDPENSLETGIYFQINQKLWSQAETEQNKVRKASIFQAMTKTKATDFALSYKIHEFMKQTGFDYLFDHCVKFEVDTTLPQTLQKGVMNLGQRLKMSLREQRLAHDGGDSSQRHAQISQLERHISPEQLE